MKHEAGKNISHDIPNPLIPETKVREITIVYACEWSNYLNEEMKIYSKNNDILEAPFIPREVGSGGEREEKQGMSPEKKDFCIEKGMEISFGENKDPVIENQVPANQPQEANVKIEMLNDIHINETKDEVYPQDGDNKNIQIIRQKDFELKNLNDKLNSFKFQNQIILDENKKLLEVITIFKALQSIEKDESNNSNNNIQNSGNLPNSSPVANIREVEGEGDSFPHESPKNEIKQRPQQEKTMKTYPKTYIQIGKPKDKKTYGLLHQNKTFSSMKGNSYGQIQNKKSYISQYPHLHPNTNTNTKSIPKVSNILSRMKESNSVDYGAMNFGLNPNAHVVGPSIEENIQSLSPSSSPYQKSQEEKEQIIKVSMKKNIQKNKNEDIIENEKIEDNNYRENNENESAFNNSSPKTFEEIIQILEKYREINENSISCLLMASNNFDIEKRKKCVESLEQVLMYVDSFKETHLDCTDQYMVGPLEDDPPLGCPQGKGGLTYPQDKLGCMIPFYLIDKRKLYENIIKYMFGKGTLKHAEPYYNFHKSKSMRNMHPHKSSK